MFQTIADAHCHLPLESGAVLCASACFPNDWRSLADFKNFPIKKAFGIHPFALLEEDFDAQNSLIELEKYLSQADALGEIGLDAKVSKCVYIDMQKELFAKQLELAKQYNLPVIIHTSECVGDTFSVLEQVCETKFLLHAAKFSAEMTKRFEKLGAYFSFGLRELSTKNGIACAQNASADRIMLESDTNGDVASLENALARLADLRDLSSQKLRVLTLKNFFNFYGNFPDAT